MTERYQGLVKFSKEPFAKVMAHANVHIKTQLDSPASAGVDVALGELDEKEAWVDLILALATLLPGRERVWWACLAARDYVGPKSEKDPGPLAAAEAWVFAPTDENLNEVSSALDHAYVDDDTTHCAVSALYANGQLGPGDLAQHPAPAGASEAAAFAMNMVALGELSDKFEAHMQVLIDRALDIARGGNGRVEAEDAETEESA
ncbi:MAG: hypothetical protein AB3N23_10710 [Paracoccaceae bacterium]